MAGAGKPDLTPEERAEIRRAALRTKAEHRAADVIYAALTDAEQKAIDGHAWERAKQIVLERRVPIDGPRFGPPYGVFWSLVATERDRLWFARMLELHARQVFAVVDRVDSRTEWLENDRPAPRSRGDVTAALARLGAMPAGLEPRARSSEPTSPEWEAGRE